MKVSSKKNFSREINSFIIVCLCVNLRRNFCSDFKTAGFVSGRKVCWIFLWIFSTFFIFLRLEAKSCQSFGKVVDHKSKKKLFKNSSTCFYHFGTSSGKFSDFWLEICSRVIDTASKNSFFKTSFNFFLSFWDFERAESFRFAQKLLWQCCNTVFYVSRGIFWGK